MREIGWECWMVYKDKAVDIILPDVRSRVRR